MCLILFSWKTDPEYPFIVAANRDEFYQRPTAPLSLWDNSPVIAGRDQQEGGTWLGITAKGRFAAVTNYRRGAEMGSTFAKSRGKLCRDFLEGEMSVAEFLASLDSDAMDYGGFNVLVSDGLSLGYGSNRFFLSQKACGLKSQAYYHYEADLAPGVYGLSNHRLNTPWPKVTQTKAAFSRVLDQFKLTDHLRLKHGVVDEADLLHVLLNSQAAVDAMLPDTGIGIEKERFLSPSFIQTSLDYGTRASTILIRDRLERQTLMEQSWLAGGEKGCRTVIQLPSRQSLHERHGDALSPDTFI